jgi:hypothetical protein
MFGRWSVMMGGTWVAMSRGMRSLLAATLVGAAALTAATAHADDDSTTTTATTTKVQHEPEQSWYGGQTLATDGAAFALALAGGATMQAPGVSTALAMASLATYVLGGPIVHGTHGRGGAAVGDLVMRLAVPITGALLGAAIGSAVAPASASTCEDDGPCGGGLGGAVLGLGIGIVTASIVDATVLAYEPTAPRHSQPDQDASGIRVVPSVAVVPQGHDGALGTVGAIGTF